MNLKIETVDDLVTIIQVMDYYSHHWLPTHV